MAFLTVISFLGAVMLLLYGIHMAGEGFKKAFGTRLRVFLLEATNRPFKGLLAGISITALFQSSSATTVMLVSLVGTNLIGLTQALSVALGAAIGTTLTVQLIAFKIYDFALIFVGIGTLIFLQSKKIDNKNIGQAIIGVGFIFLALKLTIDMFMPFTESEAYKTFFYGLTDDFYLLLFFSVILTAFFQSSAATMGLAISTSYTGLISLETSMAIILGANIGTSFTAILASIESPVDAKRVAWGNLLLNSLMVILILPFLDIFTDFVKIFSEDLSRQIAVAHTFFNVLMAALFLPLLKPITLFIKKTVKGKEKEKKFAPKYLDPLLLTSPGLALAQATREALRLSSIVERMLIDSMEVIKTNDTILLEKLQDRDDNVDLLDREIKFYLTKLTLENLNESQVRREFEILAFSNNLENIGDVIDKNLMELARKKIKGNHFFSKEGFNEIELLHKTILENFSLSVSALATSDVEIARKILNHKQKFSEKERDFREAHIARLHKGLKETIDTSAIHLDLLSNFKRINSYISNIAYPILDGEKNKD